MAPIDLLQDLQIKKAQPTEKEYFLNDGGGLRLSIKPDGTKSWQFRYTFNKKRRKTTFKSYPMVSLKNARLKRTQFLDLLAQDIDPIEYLKKKREENSIDSSGMFLNVANEWLERESKRTMESTHKNKMRIFNNDIFPFLKNKHMKEIEVSHIVKIIETKQLQAHDVAQRIYNYLDNLFRYAVLKRYCKRNILVDIRKSDIIKPREAKHFAKITDPKVLCELRDSIYLYNGGPSVRNALKFVLHIPLRAENLCNLKWDYINFEERSLTIPRELMKIKNKNLDDYKLPLTDEVIEILEEQKIFTGHQQYVFLGTSNRKPLNNESPNKALQRMGFNDESRGRKIRLHGFRGTFRSMIDTLDEDNLFSFDVKERVLDHHEKNETVRAYNHKADYFNQFKPLLKFWSEYIMKL
ncbi:MAG: integrase arm-type DNA-binding domain-containing protein [Campylobacteraceae bacterium]|nr:integrase arm-type DNA-binding domain-containing protein [Campylobacteraceae bacterium]